MIDGITRDILEQRNNIENQRNRELNSNREALIKNQKKEIERLNNIIDGLEKDINNQLTMTREFDKYNEGFFNATLRYYNKLNELKGDNK